MEEKIKTKIPMFMDWKTYVRVAKRSTESTQYPNQSFFGESSGREIDKQILKSL
jgi:hypothetical protein